MEAIDVWHPIYAWLDINWKKVLCLDYSFKTVFLSVYISFLLYEIVPLKNMYNNHVYH